MLLWEVSVAVYTLLKGRQTRSARVFCYLNRGSFIDIGNDNGTQDDKNT